VQALPLLSDYADHGLSAQTAWLYGQVMSYMLTPVADQILCMPFHVQLSAVCHQAKGVMGES